MKRLIATEWRNHRAAGLILVAALVLGGKETWAANQAPNGGIQFNLTAPGARSLAMGGAFIAVADDATAAYTNPAGLTNLTVGGPEVAVELRRWSYANVFTGGGHVAGPPTQIGVDTTPGASYVETTSEQTGLSFLSIGYVLPRGFTMALYSQQTADYQLAGEDGGVFYGDLNSDCAFLVSCGRYFPSQSSAELSVVNTGLSAAREIPLTWTADANDTLSIGLGLSFHQLKLNDRTDYFFYRLPSLNSSNREAGDFFGPPDFTPDHIGLTLVRRGDDKSLGGNVGLLWKDGAGRWSAGAVYRRGPRFQVSETAVGRDLPGLPFVVLNEETRPLRVPDVYGIGLARSAARGKTRITLDYDRVLYSQRFDDRAPRTEDRRFYRVNDATEIHLGFEQVILAIDSRFVATVRLGGWTESAHGLEYHGPDQINRELLPPGDRENHWAAGLGLVFGENFQVDAAVDLSDPVDTVSISLVKFF